MMNVGILLVLGDLIRTFRRRGSRERWRTRRQVLRASAAGVCAGVVQLAILCTAKSYVLYVFASVVIVVPGMVLAVFGVARFGVFVRRVLLGYVVAALLGGIAGALDNAFSPGQLPVWMMILCILIGREGIFMMKRRLKKQEVLCTAVLAHRGRQVRCTALWDTGNRLAEGGSGRPVHIISRRVYEALGITAEDYVGLAGYCTIGKEDGILPLYEIDGIAADGIGTGGTMVAQDEKRSDAGPGTEGEHVRAVVACAGERFLEGKEYQVILNVEGADAGWTAG